MEFTTMDSDIKDNDCKENNLSCNIQLKNDLEVALSKRKQEFDCLCAISKIIVQDELSLDEKLIKIINILPDAWSFRENACARIFFRQKEFCTSNFQETIWRQSEYIHLSKEVVGAVEVFYLEQKPNIYEGPFLREERNLLKEIARRISFFLEYSFKDITTSLHDSYSELKENIKNLEVEKNNIKQFLSLNIDNIIIPTIKELSESNRILTQSDFDFLTKSIKSLSASFKFAKQDNPIKLSSREIEICTMVKNGYSSKDIAEKINISYRTVENHRTNIKKKLNINSKGINLATYLKIC